MSLKKTFLTFVLFLTTLPVQAKATQKWSQELDVPFKKHILANGLRVIIHEDHKAPIVAVNVWYHVGSKNEVVGKTGFAHLFEHLMFNGSKHFDHDYFKALDKVGSSSTNGSTGFDRTNYFQVVPAHALDTVLWLESDRMGHLLGAVNQAKLDEQRGVVQNEKRQRENQPYGKDYDYIHRYSYPTGHPYSWVPIGSMEDLNRASLADVHEWFKTYYGPANAAISIAGDINTAEVLAKVEKYFGSIPPGPPVQKLDTWIAPRTQPIRHKVQDRVPHARIYKTWNIPGLKDSTTENLSLFASVLSGGKNSRLYKRLVFDEQKAVEVDAFVDDNEIGGIFYVAASAKPGQSLKEIEAIIDAEIALLIQKGPTKDELERAKMGIYTSMVRSLEKIGGYSGKAELLIEGEIMLNDPSSYKASLDLLQFATAKDLQTSAKKWLSQGDFTLEVEPFKEGVATKDTADRSSLAVSKASLNKTFPKFETTELKNGIKLLYMKRNSAPVVDLNFIFEGGHAVEPLETLGAGRVAATLMTEGTKKLDALEYNRLLEKMGSAISAAISLNHVNVRLSTLARNLDSSLDLWAQTMFSPAFREKDFLRVQKELVDAAEYEKSLPDGLAKRLIPELLFGKGHPYAIPSSGIGSKQQILNLKLQDAVAYYKKWIQPKGATLVAVGDFEPTHLIKQLNATFGNWTAPAPTPINIVKVDPSTRTKIFMIDRKDSMQSFIAACRLAPEKNKNTEPAVLALNMVFGGTFTSRINMNLREDKHWSYGARSGISDSNVVRNFCINTSVQSNKTTESIQEIRREIEMIAGSKPVTEQELEKSQIAQTIGFSNTWETNASMLSYLSSLAAMNLGNDYYDVYLKTVPTLQPKDLQKFVPSLMAADQMTWIIVGELSQFEGGLRKLPWNAEIKVLDTEGQVIR